MVINTEERPRAEERLSHLEGAYGHLATKADVADLRTETRTGFAEAETRTNQQIAELLRENAELRRETAELRSEMRTGFAEGRTENAENQARNTRWIIAVGALVVAAVTLLDRLLG